MSNKLTKKTLLLLVVVTLFGCSEETNEAKKLGFSNVAEMKEAQAKGWHTQKKYYEDNPTLAHSKEVKTSKNANEMSISIDLEKYNNWSTFKFGDGRFEIMYPAQKAVKSQSPDMICNYSRNIIGEYCSFETEQVSYGIIYSYTNDSQANFVDEAINRIKSDTRYRILGQQNIIFNGIEMTTLSFENNSKILSTTVQRLFVKQGLAITLEVKSKENDYANLKEDGEKFFNSFKETGISSDEIKKIIAAKAREDEKVAANARREEMTAANAKIEEDEKKKRKNQPEGKNYRILFSCIDPAMARRDENLASNLIEAISQGQYQIYSAMLTNNVYARFCSSENGFINNAYLEPAISLEASLYLVVGNRKFPSLGVKNTSYGKFILIKDNNITTGVAEEN